MTKPKVSAGMWTITASAALAVAILSFAIGRAPMQSTARSSGPRLVVVIVIDQFRYDYLQRFRKHFVDGGFNRFLREGANFTHARYRHATTDTCPGHAVISTGTWANLNGIVANQWFDAKRNKRIDCADSSGGGPAGNLLRPTIGDILKKVSEDQNKVIAVSGKRSAAILLAGQAADAAYWPDAMGRFAASTDDTSLLPEWVSRFNRSGRIEAYFDKPWERILPVEAYAMLGPDDQPAERSADGMGRSFPHAMTGGPKTIGPPFYSAFRNSPYEDEVVAELASTAIREEGLGQDEITDLLAISFSSTDRIGHRFGPDSHEMLDIVVRTDRLLERLFTFLDRQVGPNHTVMVLTADHGVAPLPEIERAHAGGSGAGRVSKFALIEAANDALNAAYGKPGTGEWVAFHDFPNLYLNERAMRAKGVRTSDAEHQVKRALEGVPGVQAAFTKTRLEELQGVPDLLEPVRAALLSFHPDRSGNVIYQVLPFNVVADAGTNHGSHWDYDTHVPLMWLGPGVKSGSYNSAVSPADIVPTLMALLGIGDTLGSGGCVLHEMLVSPAAQEQECHRIGY